MKKIIFITLFLSCILFGSYQLYAQGSPPPPPDDHGSSDNQAPGGGAPVSGGLIILLSFGAAYGGKKVYKLINGGIE